MGNEHCVHAAGLRSFRSKLTICPVDRDLVRAGLGRALRARNARPPTFGLSGWNRQERFDKIPQRIWKQRGGHTRPRYLADEDQGSEVLLHALRFENLDGAVRHDDGMVRNDHVATLGRALPIPAGVAWLALHSFPQPLLDRECVAKDWQDRAILGSAGGLFRADHIDQGRDPKLLVADRDDLRARPDG